MCVDGNGLAGNSISWTGNSFNVDTTIGTLSTVLNSKLNTSSFNTYSGSTLTNINNRLLTSIFDSYSGTTAPSTYLGKTAFNTYSGTTVPNTYYNKTQINTYTGTTLIDINSRLLTTVFNGYTGTTAPAAFASKSIFNTYTGTTAPNTYYTKTQINVYTGTTQTSINNRLLTTIFNTYTGTTVPATYVTKTAYNIYTGATQTKLGQKAFLSGATFTGAIVINSSLTTTGTTIFRGTTCLGSPATGDISTDRALYYNPTTCVLRQVKLTGGSDSYFYSDNTTLSTSTGAGTVIYLSGTPWTFKAGRYQIDFSAQFGNTSVGNTFAWFALDGVTIGTCYHSCGAEGSWVSSASLSRDITLTAGCHCLTINYARGANTSCVTYGMIRAKRIC